MFNQEHKKVAICELGKKLYRIMITLSIFSHLQRSITYVHMPNKINLIILTYQIISVYLMRICDIHKCQHHNYTNAYIPKFAYFDSIQIKYYDSALILRIYEALMIFMMISFNNDHRIKKSPNKSFLLDMKHLNSSRLISATANKKFIQTDVQKPNKKPPSSIEITSET